MKQLFALLLLLPGLALARQLPFANIPPAIDGIASEALWQEGEWRALAYPMQGSMPPAEDFSARYKASWDEHYLYVLVEVSDDVLVDSTANPLERYWEDDTLEVFLDTDASGGDHLANHNAYAYHIALDGNVVDIAPPATADGEAAPALFNAHVKSAWSRSQVAPYNLVWELRVSIYDPQLQRASLRPGQQLGLMLGYCDADSAAGRDNLYTDVEIVPVNGDRNRGYIDADTFGRVTLAKP